ncbi:MAG: CoA-binding protein [archaeon]|nr:CoA-binding protein [archaeon]
MHKTKTIEPFFSPKSIAVIGASNTKGKVGYTIFANMKKAETKNVYPVNPKYGNVQGKKAYASVSAIRKKIDLAIIALPPQIVPDSLEECMKNSVKAVIIVSAGFSEVGEETLTKKISALIKKYPKTRVMGPNCVGVMNIRSKIDTTFFERSRMEIPKKGTLSFISQSGALGSMILDWVATQQFGVNKFASYGNAMDIDEADLLEYFGEDPKTKVITVYLEGARDGRKFFNIAKKVSKTTPIIVLKGGKSDETRKAASSHTGSLAGSSDVYNAVFRQSGIIQADDLLDLFNIAKLLEKEPLPKGNRVLVITNGGGFGIVAADQIISHGLKLAKLSKKSEDELKAALPRASIGNPIDLLGDADIESYKKAIGAAQKDKNVDIIMVLVLFNLPTIEAKKIMSLKKARASAAKPTVVCAIGSDYTKKYMKKIEKAGFTTFNYPSVAAKALKEMVSYAAYLKKTR